MLLKPIDIRDIQQTEDSLLIIDVRSVEEYEVGHVEGAVHIPIDELSEHLQSLDVDQTIVTYCMMNHPGTSRGERAAALLREQGFNAYTLDGGLPAWKVARMPMALVESDK
ncbi:MAG: rhodanese-like domain-containing protein [Chloroflexota bacterium]